MLLAVLGILLLWSVSSQLNRDSDHDPPQETTNPSIAPEQKQRIAQPLEVDNQQKVDQGTANSGQVGTQYSPGYYDKFKP